ILFRSDPPPLLNGFGFLPGNSVGCVELALSGCTFRLDVGPAILTIFSDGDFVLPSPNSDLVAITPTPEPSEAEPSALVLGMIALVQYARSSALPTMRRIRRIT